MNPRAAEELLNLIMLDDTVARRKALDDWSRRWLTTLHVEAPLHLSMSLSRQQCIEKIIESVIHNPVHALWWGREPDKLVAEMHVVMQEPRET